MRKPAGPPLPRVPHPLCRQDCRSTGSEAGGEDAGFRHLVVGVVCAASSGQTRRLPLTQRSLTAPLTDALQAGELPGPHSGPVSGLTLLSFRQKQLPLRHLHHSLAFRDCWPRVLRNFLEASPDVISFTLPHTRVP